jgi:ribosomal protein L1
MIKKNLGRYLGQKRLMPSEKLGTVTTDIPQAIADNALTVEWKATREGNIDASQ